MFSFRGRLLVATFAVCALQGAVAIEVVPEWGGSNHLPKDDDRASSNSWRSTLLGGIFRRSPNVAAEQTVLEDALATFNESLASFEETTRLAATGPRTGRSLLKKEFFYWKSTLDLNRGVTSAKGASNTIPLWKQQSLPAHYVPDGSTEKYFKSLQKRYKPDSFRRGRGSYYGINPKAGDSIDVGSCGYSYIHKGEACGNSCLDIAALSDKNPAYPRSCGTCYEVGCQPATFTDGYSNVIFRSKACRNADQTLVVRITDTCPCIYPNNAASNKRWCCGDGGRRKNIPNLPHFDMSVNAFEKLAEPGVGVIGLRWRRVPCWYQPTNPAKRPAVYHRENSIPSWNKNPSRGWNWTTDVANWVTTQRMYPPKPDNVRNVKPSNVTGAGVTGAVPSSIVGGR